MIAFIDNDNEKRKFHCHKNAVFQKRYLMRFLPVKKT